MPATEQAPPVTLDNRITLGQAGKLYGKSPSCIFRWIRDGCHGVKLDHARYGGSIFTSKEAIDTFAHRVAQARSNRKPGRTN